MSINDKIHEIIEKRTIEANRKEIALKAKTIAKMFGSTIISEDFFSADMISVACKPFNRHGNQQIEDDNNSLPIMDIDDSSEAIGIHYHPLRSGMDIEIKCLFAEDLVEIHFDGDLVYREIGGKVVAYKPEEKWEKAMDAIYHTASKKSKMETPRLQQEEKQKNAELQRNMVFDYLKRFWGV